MTTNISTFSVVDDAATTSSTSASNTRNGISTVAAAVSSSPWESDESQINCTECGVEFTHMNRRRTYNNISLYIVHCCCNSINII